MPFSEQIFNLYSELYSWLSRLLKSNYEQTNRHMSSIGNVPSYRTDIFLQLVMSLVIVVLEGITLSVFYQIRLSVFSCCCVASQLVVPTEWWYLTGFSHCTSHFRGDFWLHQVRRTWKFCQPCISQQRFNTTIPGAVCE